MLPLRTILIYLTIFSLIMLAGITNVLNGEYPDVLLMVFYLTVSSTLLICSIMRAKWAVYTLLIWFGFNILSLIFSISEDFFISIIGVLIFAFFMGGVWWDWQIHSKKVNTPEKNRMDEVAESVEGQVTENVLAEEHTVDYASLPVRIKSVVVDSIVVVVLLCLFAIITNSISNPPEWLRISLLAFAFGLYEPLCTATVGTVGQNMFGIKVRRLDNMDLKLSLWMALRRYIVKCLLGTISFIAISFTSRKVAIHDMAAGSIVIYK
mgnify:CR=1 FL=1